MEDNLRRALTIYDDSMRFMWERPLTLGINIVTLFILAYPMIKSLLSAVREKRKPETLT